MSKCQNSAFELAFGIENSPNETRCSSCNSPIGHVERKVLHGTLEGSQSSGTGSGKTKWWVAAGVCGLYLVYPSLGIFELIPDSLPIIGSLDEAAATTGLLISLTNLGLNPFKTWQK